MKLAAVKARVVSSVPLTLMLAKAGASSTGVKTTLNWLSNVAEALSTPTLAVPPSSRTTMVTVAVPLAFVAVVKVNVPSAAIAGWVANRLVLLLLNTKLMACEASLAGPTEVAVK